MIVIYGLYIFILGTIIGSFLNVVTLRQNTGRTLLGRSGCGSCGSTLRWFELVPVVSYLLQRGRCRRCGSKISLQYPVVEAAVGLMFLWAFYLHGLSSLLLIDFGIISTLTAITVYDLKHKIIPDRYVLLLIVTALVHGSYLYYSGVTLSVLIAKLIVAGLIFSFFWLVWLFSQGQAMGLGDGKLAFATSLLLLPNDALSAVLFSFWSGALVSLGVILVQRLAKKKGLGFKSELPFAPFLVLGFLLVYFFEISLPTLF